MITQIETLAEYLRVLESGPVYYFRDWPNNNVPNVAAGVYTIWAKEQLIYVGMSGRSLTAKDILDQRRVSPRAVGLFPLPVPIPL